MCIQCIQSVTARKSTKRHVLVTIRAETNKWRMPGPAASSAHCADNTTLQMTANMHDDYIHIVHYYNEDRPQQNLASVENATMVQCFRLWPGVSAFRRVLDTRDLFLGSVFVVVMHYVYAIIMHVSGHLKRCIVCTMCRTSCRAWHPPFVRFSSYRRHYMSLRRLSCGY